jgi:hypothetical protein
VSKADSFLKKTLGEDFFDSLAKVELWKPGTKGTLDHEEIRTALQIVPRTVIAFLIRELVPMEIGERKEIKLPVAENAIMRATKNERDVFSGEIEEDQKKIVEFKLRSLPGVGLVIMSAFELYDMENLINSANLPMPTPQVPEPQPTQPPPAPEFAQGAESKVQNLIDERLALHDLIGKVIDKKIMEKDAINQLVLGKLTEAVKMVNDKVETAKHDATCARLIAVNTQNAVVKMAMPNKSKKPLENFLAGRQKPKEFSVFMAKGETFQCPDCRKNIFDGQAVSPCICYGDCGKIFLKKTENGIKLRFSKGWDLENIEMLLEVLQRKNK